VVWKKKRSVSTKPEDVNHSTIDVSTLQKSLALPNKQQKPEPIYPEICDQHNNLKNNFCASSTQGSVIMPAYSNPKNQVILEDDPTSCYSDAKGQGLVEVDPAYFNPRVMLQLNNPVSLCDSYPKEQAIVENDLAYYNPMVRLQDNLAHFNPKKQVVVEDDPAYGNTSRYKEGKE